LICVRGIRTVVTRIRNTISVPIICGVPLGAAIAGVADAVTVGIVLCWISRQRTVVFCIHPAVAIGIRVVVKPGAPIALVAVPVTIRIDLPGFSRRRRTCRGRSSRGYTGIRYGWTVVGPIRPAVLVIVGITGIADFVPVGIFLIHAAHAVQIPGRIALPVLQAPGCELTLDACPSQRAVRREAAVIAGVAHTIAIAVRLAEVEILGAVVARIRHSVAVAVRRIFVVAGYETPIPVLLAARPDRTRVHAVGAQVALRVAPLDPVAENPVVADNGIAADAITRDASVGLRARITVVTECVVRNTSAYATCNRVTGIVGANVSIVAESVTGRVDAGVVYFVARINRTGDPIIAIRGRTGLASTIDARFGSVTENPVVTVPVRDALGLELVGTHVHDRGGAAVPSVGAIRRVGVVHEARIAV
jgi:hypothetical protein